MYAALRALRAPRVDQSEAAAAAADKDKHDEGRDGVNDIHSQNSPHVQSYSDLKNESDLQLESRKRKEENQEPDPIPEKISRQDEEQRLEEAPSIKNLPPKKLNADGSFGDPKPKHQSSGRIPQPWLCPVQSCGRNNFQWRKTCPHCATPKPQGVVSFLVVNKEEGKTNQRPPQSQPPPSGNAKEEKKKNVAAECSRPPAEVAMGNKNNANLEDLGQKRGGVFGGRGRGRVGSDGASMAERLAKMAGMAGVPPGFCQKEEEKSWADVKSKMNSASAVEGSAEKQSVMERTEETAVGRPGWGRLGFGESFGSFRGSNQPLPPPTRGVGGPSSTRGGRGGRGSRGGPNGGARGRGGLERLERLERLDTGPAALFREEREDWLCPNPACRNSNFSWRAECNRCGAPRPSLGNSYSEDLQAGRDWTCDNFFCRQKNPANRTRCSQCEVPRQQEEDDGVCKDFKNGNCNRLFCKFSHDISKLQLCGDFQKGRCIRDNCRYVHVKEPPKPKLPDACADYQNGNCSRSNCRFQHIEKDEDPKKDICKDFQNGRCSRDKCRFRHIDDFDYQREQMARYSAGPGINKKEKPRLPGWDSYPKPVASTATNAFTPIWPAVPAQQRAVSEETNQDNSGPGSEIPTNISPGLRRVLERVTEATTPLSSVSYGEQLSKKMRESKAVSDQIGAEILAANNSTKNWIDFQTNKFGHCARIDNIKESVALEGYRNKCEFAIGLNPDNRMLTVGFKLDPRSASPDVGPVDHLRHVPKRMKEVVKMLEKYLRSTKFKHFDYQTGSGHWVTAVVKMTLQEETLININFVPQNLSAPELKYVKTGLRNYFEFGEGSRCKVTSLFFSEKSLSGQGSLVNLYGPDAIVETMFDLKFLISPRAYFCINTKGAETLVNTIAVLANLHRNLTLLDICCGTGTIGLSLAQRVGNVQGVDLAGEAVDDARRNMRINKIDNAHFVAGPAEELIPQMIGQASHEEIVAVIDPPRAGIAMKAIRQLRASRIKKIVYVSSDPKSSIKNFIDLARPSSTTFFGDPFMPILVQPVDIFPHTSHYMTVVLLTRVAQADLLHPHRANMELYYGGLPAHKPPATEESQEVPPPPPGTETQPPLTPDQTAWLNQMVKTYGSTFQKDRWVASMVQQNRQTSAVAPRPPSPSIPPMPAFPVAPKSNSPEEYSKYKKDYDAYTDWYNKYAVLYAAKKDQKNKVPCSNSPSSKGGLPDPNDVPAGVDPVAWRKYCNDTRDYHAKFKSHQPNIAEQAKHSREAITEKIADQILGNRGLKGFSM